MNIQTFKENDQYKLYLDGFNYIVLYVSYVEYNIAWMHGYNKGNSVGYKYNLDKHKLY